MRIDLVSGFPGLCFHTPEMDADKVVIDQSDDTMHYRVICHTSTSPCPKNTGSRMTAIEYSE